MILKKIYVSVDSGKSHTKVAWYRNNNTKDRIMSDSFRTVLDKNEQSTDFSSGGRLIEYRNNVYEVGGNDEPVLDSDNTKLSELHEICTLTAIAQTLIYMKVQLHHTHHIHLAINVPLSDYMNKKEDYLNKYKSKCVKLNIDNKSVSFVISDVSLNPEGVGVIVRNTTEATGSYYVIDLGGRNDTHILFENLRPTKGKNGATNNGVLRLLQHIASELSSDYDFTIRNIEDIIFSKKQKPVMFDEVFEKHAKGWAIRIRNQAQKFSLNPHFVKILVSGGGGILLREQLAEVFKDFDIIFAEDARFDNTKGALTRAIVNK